MKTTKTLIILIATIFVANISFAQNKSINNGSFTMLTNYFIGGNFYANYLPEEVDSLCFDFYDKDSGVLLSVAHFATPNLYTGNYSFYAEFISGVNEFIESSREFVIGGSTPPKPIFFQVLNYPAPEVARNHNLKLEIYLMLKAASSKGVRKSNVLTFYFDVTTGINSTTATVKTFDVNAYVNQSNKELTLNITNPTNVLSISIINQLGQVLNVWDENTINTQLVKQIDVSNYKAGIYYIQVSNGQNSTVKKIIL